MEKLFLANGLRFICTPPLNQIDSIKSQLLSDSNLGWQRFSRTLGQKMIEYSNEVEQPNQELQVSVNKKFTIQKKFKNASYAQATEDKHRPELAAEFNELDKYRQLTFKLLTQITTLNHNHLLSTHPRRNYSNTELNFIRSLMSDRSITIKPADKNLGLVLVDTNWYNNELKRMLSDKITYQAFKQYEFKRGKSVDQLKALLKDLHLQVQQLAKQYTTELDELHPSAKTYLEQGMTEHTAQVPSIYLLIKVHKPNGLCGRPIVPSHSWSTSAASKIVDQALQEIVKAANITHLVKDTKSLVNELEKTPIFNKAGVFITADIASLYTNIDTALGLKLVQEFLIEQKIPTTKIQFIISLLTFVMKNSYLRFQDHVYHQIDGTAMGTACAPIYANIIVYMLERTLLKLMQSFIYVYKRYLDDVFIYADPSSVEAIMIQFNQLHPKLRFDFQVSTNECSFLDLCIFKGIRFSDEQDNRFDLRVHQKSMNLYLYIPYHSFHPIHAKISFITTELQRYIRNCSDMKYYIPLKHLFYQRLRDRGYPSNFLLPIFNNIWYDDRKYFLMSTNEIKAQMEFIQPRSTCLIKKIDRFTRNTLINADSSYRPIFIIPYSPLTVMTPIRSILSRHWQLVQNAFIQKKPNQPIMAYQATPNLLTKLVFMKAKQEDKERNEKNKISITKQLTMNSFLDHQPL
ncbi:MAG TPA: hypothetical protein VHA52_13810 [Candidatus Babeliaceae bacterium]|nr:hypothetical protein [Candidatus Babeliaceae bacterium]